jgi:hypothetical protein
VWGVVVSLLAWLLPIHPAVAVESCDFSDGLYRLHLSEGQDEVHCVSQFDNSIDQKAKQFWGAAWFTVDGDGTYEFRIDLETRKTSIQSPPGESAENEEPELRDVIGVDEYVQVNFRPGVTKGYDPWSVKKIVRHDVENDRSTAIDYSIAATQWDENAREVKLNVTFALRLSIKRVESGCWVEGTVRGKSVYGHNAYWSNSPTGIDDESGSMPVVSTDQANQMLGAVANMDIEALAKLGLDPKQLANAKANASSVGVEAGDTKKSSEDLKGELAEFKGHSFLMLQSVKSDDDVTRVYGPSAGIAGDISLPDLAMGIGHVLSQFSFTAEMENPKPGSMAWAIVRAGLVNEGLKYTWPGEGGAGPTVVFKPCESQTVGSEVRCGTVRWPDVANLDFQANHGAFSCINN